MTPTEAVRLTGYIQAHFPSQPINEFTPDALGELLADYPAADCHDAVLALATRGEKWCAPSDVASEVRRMRTKRLALAGDLCPPPGLTDAEEREWLGQARRQIADGEDVVADMGELTPRNLPDLRSLVRRMDPPRAIETADKHAARKAADAELETLRQRLAADQAAALEPPIPPAQRDPGCEVVVQAMSGEVVGT